MTPTEQLRWRRWDLVAGVVSWAAMVYVMVASWPNLDWVAAAWVVSLAAAVWAGRAWDELHRPPAPRGYRYLYTYANVGVGFDPDK